MPEVPPNAVRAGAPPGAPASNNGLYIKRLGLEFRSLVAGLRHPVRVVAGGPADISSVRLELGQLDALAGGRRAPGGPPELIGEVLDPLCRSLAAPLSPALVAPSAPSLAAPGGSPAGAGSAAELAAVEEAVRRVAWGGDRRAGVARIELGGALVGTAVVVRGEGREVQLSIELGSGSDAGALPARLVERLRARGLAVTTVEVL